MKKLATALVSAAAIMTMSTTAFAAENPAEVFDRVMEKNNTIQSAEIQSGVHSVILAKDVIPDGQMKVDMAMHAEMDMQDTTDLKYLAQVASSILGQDSYSQVFYTDGYYYVDTNGVKASRAYTENGRRRMCASMLGTFMCTNCPGSMLAAICEAASSMR